MSTKKGEVHIENHIPFLKLLLQFQTVERVAYAPDLKRNENDVEHSYLLAMLAWQILDAYQLPLDRDKVLRYALAHDFVEVYAGDTYFEPTRNETHTASKHEREVAAAARIAAEHPEFPDLHATIAQYEQREDPESAFVYALDKHIPSLINYIQDGKRHRDENVTRRFWVANKREKCAGAPIIAELMEQMITLMTARESEFFVRE